MLKVIFKDFFKKLLLTAKELWKENYAVKGGQEKSVAPNAMWTKRPYGQIAKCAEAQALRKAFPEIGSEPTADEMAGKTINEFEGTVIDVDTGEVSGRKPAVATPQRRADTQPPSDQSDVLATQGEIAFITKKIAASGMSIAEVCEKVGLAARDTLEGLTKDGFIALRGAV